MDDQGCILDEDQFPWLPPVEGGAFEVEPPTPRPTRGLLGQAPPLLSATHDRPAPASPFVNMVRVTEAGNQASGGAAGRNVSSLEQRLKALRRAAPLEMALDDASRPYVLGPGQRQLPLCCMELRPKLHDLGLQIIVEFPAIQHD